MFCHDTLTAVREWSDNWRASCSGDLAQHRTSVRAAGSQYHREIWAGFWRKRSVEIQTAPNLTLPLSPSNPAESRQVREILVAQNTGRGTMHLNLSNFNLYCVLLPIPIPILTRVSKLALPLINKSSSHSTTPRSNNTTMVDPPNAKYPNSSPRFTS